jgi:Lar family restriction alleviation protein
MPELDPCPFCGNEHIELKRAALRSDKVIECQRCGATGPRSVNECYMIEWWNKGLLKKTEDDGNIPF